MPGRILVVEDDPVIGGGLAQALEGQGYEVDWAENGGDALRWAARLAYDLMLLDLGLPDIDGVTLCGQLRTTQPQTTILMLTARTSEIDVVVGLDSGADDYLTKPFRLGELTARIRAHLRRSQLETVKPARFVVGSLVLDRDARRVWQGDDEVELRPKEFDLLTLLMASAGSAVTRETIMAEVWDEHWYGSTKTLDMHISALRRKLGDSVDATRMITTLRGVGYRFERA
jgi:DNA-binding response OmpR family regulator